jgi:spore germination protein YaaH
MRLARTLGAAATLLVLALGWSLSSRWRRPPPIYVSAWAVDWSEAALQDATASIERAGETIREIDLFRLRLSEEGALSDSGPMAASQDRLLRMAADRGMARTLTLVNDVSADPPRPKDEDLVTRILADPGRQTALVAAIIDRLRTEAATALDLDFEQLHASDRDEFSRFVTELSARLHEDGKRLVVTVQPQLDAETRDGPGAQDLASLARAADEIRVMAYHVHYGTTDPGASAPLPWTRSLVENVLRSVPAQKLVLALYVGGWQWSKGKGEQVSFAESRALAKTLGAKRQWSSTDQVPFFEGASPSGRVSVWYEDACSLSRKIELVRELKLRGVALWRLGQEDPAFYDVLRGSAGSCGTDGS